MKNIFAYFILIITLLVPTTAKADVFPISTEMQIGRIKNLIDRAPQGIYLTVGGERAFRGASMFEDIDHLIIFDMAPEIIRYNKINIELLKAPNKEVYKHLRWEGTFQDWKKLSNNLNEDDFKWWDENIRNIKGYTLPEDLNRYGSAVGIKKYLTIRQKLMEIYPRISSKFNNYEKAFLENVIWAEVESHQKGSKDPLTREDFEWFDEERKYPNSCIEKFITDPALAVDWGQVIDYKSGNYLFDDRLYARLHALVLKNKITVIQADLTKQKDIDLIVEKIHSLDKSLAILDMDNLYAYDYMGEEKFRVVLSKFLELGTKNSILILMDNYKDYPCAQFSIYLGFTFENVDFWPKTPFFESFMENLPHDISPLIDGRLYEGREQLPLYLKR